MKLAEWTITPAKEPSEQQSADQTLTDSVSSHHKVYLNCGFFLSVKSSSYACSKASISPELSRRLFSQAQ